MQNSSHWLLQAFWDQGWEKTNLQSGFDTTPHPATRKDLTKLLKGKFCQLNEDSGRGHSWFGVHLRTSADKVTFSCVTFAFCVSTLSSMTNIFLRTLNLICQAGVWANVHFHSTLYPSFFSQGQSVSQRMNTENPKSDRIGFSVTFPFLMQALSNSQEWRRTLFVSSLPVPCPHDLDIRVNGLISAAALALLLHVMQYLGGHRQLGFSIWHWQRMSVWLVPRCVWQLCT